VKPQELDQHNHDAEAEVEIPGRGARQDRRNLNSISVQSQQQPSLPLQDEIGDANVKACDQQAKAEACDFEAHISMVTKISGALNIAQDPVSDTIQRRDRRFSHARIELGLTTPDDIRSAKSDRAAAD
jgi:hypothetical protein